MSNPFIAVSGYVILTGLYWYLYFLFRKKISHIIFLTFFAVVMVGPIPYIGLKYFMVESFYLNVCMLIMIIFSILHHLSLVKGMEKIHGAISHLGFFIPLGAAGLIGFYLLSPKALFIGDLIILYL